MLKLRKHSWWGLKLHRGRVKTAFQAQSHRAVPGGIKRVSALGRGGFN